MPAGGQGGQCPPDFHFCPPRFISCPPRYFFGRKKLLFWPEKTLKFVISVRTNFRISAKTFFFFGDHLVLAGKFVISARKSHRISAKTFFLEITCFWPEKNVKISARKSLRKSAKTFAPLDFNFAPPISRSWRRPCLEGEGALICQKHNLHISKNIEKWPKLSNQF